MDKDLEGLDLLYNACRDMMLAGKTPAMLILHPAKKHFLQANVMSLFDPGNMNVLRTPYGDVVLYETFEVELHDMYLVSKEDMKSGSFSPEDMVEVHEDGILADMREHGVD